MPRSCSNLRHRLIGRLVYGKRGVGRPSGAMNKAPRVELQCEKISALKFFGVFDDSEEEISYDEEEEEIL